jgi:hypothetical protein
MERAALTPISCSTSPYSCSVVSELLESSSWSDDDARRKEDLEGVLNLRQVMKLEEFLVLLGWTWRRRKVIWVGGVAGMEFRTTTVAMELDIILFSL